MYVKVNPRDQTFDERSGSCNFINSNDHSANKVGVGIIFNFAEFYPDNYLGQK